MPVPDSEITLLDWLEQIREPLRMLYNLEDEVTFIAWELARWQPGINLIERQAVIMLILMALVHLRMGSTRIALHGEKGKALRLDFASRLLGDVEAVQAADMMAALVDSERANALIGQVGAFKPLIVTDGHLYLQKMLHLEDRFVVSIQGRQAARIPGWPEEEVEAALHDLRTHPAVQDGQIIGLKDEQQVAVRAALRYPLTIISGGPGTGKTTVIVSILRVLRRLGITCPEIALAAPTGKAANRMKEAVQSSLIGVAERTESDRDLDNLAEPRTLHRLLGYSHQTGRFLHHENNRLAARVVIVDEASMIDLALMERLVRSLRDDARFILLGDAHQLPSIGAGAVLRDLLGEESAEAPTKSGAVRLTHSYRMRRDDDDGRNVFIIAREINSGTRPVFAATRTNDEVVVKQTSVADIKFRGVEFLEVPDGSPLLHQFLERWHGDAQGHLVDLDQLASRPYALVQEHFMADDEKRLCTLFEHWGGFRILCVTRVLPTGSDRVNAILHQHAIDQRSCYLRALGLPDPPQDEGFIPGEPVMMQVNDYKRMIFNGDQGLILNVTDGAMVHLTAVFPRSGGFAAFHLESLRSVLLHCYTMTVHKAQGSEFDQVALILPDRDLPISTREVLYTALTRSRSSTVVIGRRDIFESAITRVSARDSGIAEKLRSKLGEG
jgi:exodeoxyribonuclease V alpha subunit